MKTGTGALFTGPPRYAPQTPWGVLSALAATAVVAVAPAAVLLVVIGVVARRGGGEADSGPSVEGLFSLATPEGVALAAAIQIASLALVWLLAGRGGQRAEVLRLTGARFSRALYAAGALTLVVLTALVELLLYKTFAIDIFADTAWLREGLNSPVAWGTALIAVVLAPLWEEFTFRGFLLSALARSPLGFWGGAVVSNSLWTTLHATYSWAGLVSVFLAGLILSWLVWRTGSIKPALVAHGVGNLVALAVTYAFAPVAA